MRDPVTGFDYPEDWVARCLDADDLRLARQGFAVLTSDGRVLRRGYTTGTTATAAVKACLLSARKGRLEKVGVLLNCGMEVEVPVEAEGGVASARKYGGDYKQDVTAGLRFTATLLSFGDEFVLEAGEGIGRLARDTPRYRRGQASISPDAMRQISDNARAACQEIGEKGARVLLEAVSGREVAMSTLNERMGTMGGISVLGTTGLVEPWDDHLGEAAIERVRRSDKVVLTTGRVGLGHARRMFPDHEVVLVGVNIAEALSAAPGQVILCGLPALILKFIDPEVLAGTGFETVEDLMESPSAKTVLGKEMMRFKRTYPRAGLVIVDRMGRILGEMP